jgi:CDP-glucose 4,6-dehydratase
VEGLVVMPMFGDFYRGKSVLVTGHTGFKGSWLCSWLIALGARVSGYSLAPNTDPSLFRILELERRVHRHSLGDIRDRALVSSEVGANDPDVIFHMAAQPLVRLSYKEPLETYETNVMGTANLLESVRVRNKPCTVVVVTTDKCYLNREWVHGYREDDPLGGADPYSSSKACCELVVSAYRQSYFDPSSSPIRLTSARAGNVIGGGDWALDRIVPDCIRNLQSGQAISVRNRVATRPWQHVLDPVCGYLLLGQRLSAADAVERRRLSSAYNFGPPLQSNKTVEQLVKEVLLNWPGSWVDKSDPNTVHEAQLLNLATDKAYHQLEWQSVWNFEESVKQTIDWYLAHSKREVAMAEFTAGQIDRYCESARFGKIAWTK